MVNLNTRIMTFASFLGPWIRLAACLAGPAALFADSNTFTLAPLPPYLAGGVPEARVDSLTITLDPTGPDLVGKPGDTVGWGFKIAWASNAGDSIVFGTSALATPPDGVSSSGYTDRLAQAGGNFQGRVLAGTEWAAPTPFNPGVDGVGYLTIDADAVPGTVYAGTLNLRFTVYDISGAAPLPLNNFFVPIPVTITVVPGEPQPQTIAFAAIPDQAVTAAPFAITAQSTSGLPVTVFSLTPELCTVENGVATLHSAGSCVLVAVQEGDQSHEVAESIYQSFEITKVPATLTLQGDLDQTYDGTDKLLTATTAPSGLAVKWLYNGEETPPRAPGIYVIDAWIDDSLQEGRAQARLTITDTSPAPLAAYADWLLEHFTPQEIQAGLVTAQTADLAADGTPNLLKYALGLDPWTTMPPEARSALPRFAGTGGTNALVFSLPVTPSGDIIIKVEASSDLVTWTEIARRTRGGPWTGAASVFIGTPDETGTRAQTLVTEPAGPVYDRRFYRLNLDFAP